MARHLLSDTSFAASDSPANANGCLPRCGCFFINKPAPVWVPHKCPVPGAMQPKMPGIQGAGGNQKLSKIGKNGQSWQKWQKKQPKWPKMTKTDKISKQGQNRPNAANMTEKIRTTTQQNAHTARHRPASEPHLWLPEFRHRPASPYIALYRRRFSPSSHGFSTSHPSKKRPASENWRN